MRALQEGCGFGEGGGRLCQAAGPTPQSPPPQFSPGGAQVEPPSHRHQQRDVTVRSFPTP